MSLVTPAEPAQLRSLRLDQLTAPEGGDDTPIEGRGLSAALLLAFTDALPLVAARAGIRRFNALHGVGETDAQIDAALRAVLSPGRDAASGAAPVGLRARRRALVSRRLLRLFRRRCDARPGGSMD